MKKIEKFDLDFSKDCQFLCQIIYDQTLAYTFLLSFKEMSDTNFLDKMLEEMDEKVILAINSDCGESEFPSRKLAFIGYVYCGEVVAACSQGENIYYYCGNVDLPVWRREYAISDDVE